MDVSVKTRRCFFADLSPVVGSEQGGNRPVLIIQNNVGNHYSPTVIVAAITSRFKTQDADACRVTAKQDGVERNSVILLEQIRTIDKQRLQSPRDSSVRHQNGSSRPRVGDFSGLGQFYPAQKI